MIVLDTDTLTHLLAEQPRVVERYRREADEVVSTIISRIEVLQGRFATLLKAANGLEHDSAGGQDLRHPGRFATLLKAANGLELQRGQQRLDQAEHALASFRILPVNAAATAEFDRRRENKKLRKMGRADLLIAAITLANRATLVTHNLKDFRPVPGLQIENWAD